MEKEEIQVVVMFSEKISQDAVWVATFYLVGRQAKVDALYKVPELSHRVIVEPPGAERDRGNNYSLLESQKREIFFVCVCFFISSCFNINIL